MFARPIDIASSGHSVAIRVAITTCLVLMSPCLLRQRTNIQGLTHLPPSPGSRNSRIIAEE